MPLQQPDTCVRVSERLQRDSSLSPARPPSPSPEQPVPDLILESRRAANGNLMCSGGGGGGCQEHVIHTVLQNPSCSRAASTLMSALF